MPTKRLTAAQKRKLYRLIIALSDTHAAHAVVATEGNGDAFERKLERDASRAARKLNAYLATL